MPTVKIMQHFAAMSFYVNKATHFVALTCIAIVRHNYSSFQERPLRDAPLDTIFPTEHRYACRRTDNTDDRQILEENHACPRSMSISCTQDIATPPVFRKGSTILS